MFVPDAVELVAETKDCVRWSRVVIGWLGKVHSFALGEATIVKANGVALQTIIDYMMWSRHPMLIRSHLLREYLQPPIRGVFRCATARGITNCISVSVPLYCAGGLSFVCQ